jgi:hypothetical protein
MKNVLMDSKFIDYSELIALGVCSKTIKKSKNIVTAWVIQVNRINNAKAYEDNEG